jgi:hypothetical protein
MDILRIGGESMRQALSIVLALLLFLQLAPAVFGADDVAGQIAAMPSGTHIDVHLKNKQVLRGTTGEVSTSGFTLVNLRAGDRQLAFADVTSVKRVAQKSHKRRNILIIGGVAFVAVVAALGIYIKKCPVGCR